MINVFAYFSDKQKYISELDVEYAADILERMDSDEAYEVLDELPEDEKNIVLTLMEEEAKINVRKILKYEDDEIGSYLTDNYITINAFGRIKDAMK